MDADRGRVLVTGAAGRVGRVLVPGLTGLGWSVRALDRVPVEPGPGVEPVAAELADRAALDAAVTGVDAVVHLAAIPVEAPFDDILTENIDGTYRTMDAARRAGVERFVYASSNHAVGFAPRQPLIPADTPPRPDTYYGLSKVFGEALGRLYVDRFGMRFAGLRIGSFDDRPRSPRGLSTWLSHGDAVRLVHACLTAPDLTYALVWGISANTRRWFDLEPGRALGYQPADDAEVYADEILAQRPVAPADRGERLLGGEYTAPDYLG